MTLSAVFRKPARICVEACELAMSEGTPWRAAKLAIVVGTLLILINQWEVVAGAAKIDWMKVILTYCVPYMVSTYTSVSKDMHLRRAAEAAEQFVHGEAKDLSESRL